MTRARGAFLLAGLLGAAVVVSRCESVPLTAPSGSSIFLQANPAFVPANGGRSLVTALVVEPAGTLVADGTQVLFFTDLGTVESTAKTMDGLARVYFVSDARSGTATVTAMSGGPAVEPAPTPTPDESPDTSGPDLQASRGSSEAARLGGLFNASTGAAAAVAAEATVTIEVGAMLPTRVIVGADPLRITSQRRSTIVANVYDERGNPVQNVPVIFRILSVEEGSPTTTTTTTTTTTSTTSTTTTTTTTTTMPSLPFEERLDSGGAPRYTDSSGQAFDVLRTTDPVGGVQKIVTIEATTSNGVSGQVVVAID